MSQMPPPLSFAQPRQTNGLGIAGFVVSLVGLISCGVLSPIGLLLSIIAMFRAPRGFAIAGLVIGLAGSIGAIVAFVFIGLTAILAAAGIGAAVPIIVTEVRMAQIAEAVAEHKNPDGTFLTDVATLPGISAEDRNDVWGHPFHIVVKGTNEFEVVSDGPDGIAGNSDDIHSNTTSDGDKPRHRAKRKKPAQVD